MVFRRSRHIKNRRNQTASVRVPRNHSCQWLHAAIPARFMPEPGEFFHYTIPGSRLTSRRGDEIKVRVTNKNYSCRARTLLCATIVSILLFFQMTVLLFKTPLADNAARGRACMKKAQQKTSVGLSRPLHFPDDEKRIPWLTRPVPGRRLLRLPSRAPGLLPAVQRVHHNLSARRGPGLHAA